MPEVNVKLRYNSFLSVFFSRNHMGTAPSPRGGFSLAHCYLKLSFLVRPALLFSEMPPGESTRAFPPLLRAPGHSAACRGAPRSAEDGSSEASPAAALSTFPAGDSSLEANKSGLCKAPSITHVDSIVSRALHPKWKSPLIKGRLQLLAGLEVWAGVKARAGFNKNVRFWKGRKPPRKNIQIQ